MLRLVAMALAISLSACASSSAVIVGTQRAAIAPDAVRLYLKPPAKYEEVALLDASSKNSFAATEQGKMDVVIERLKAEAARLGANGVLLQSSGSESSGAVGMVMPGSGLMYMGNAMHKAARAIAIHVPQ